MLRGSLVVHDLILTRPGQRWLWGQRQRVGRKVQERTFPLEKKKMQRRHHSSLMGEMAESKAQAMPGVLRLALTSIYPSPVACKSRASRPQLYNGNQTSQAYQG